MFYLYLINRSLPDTVSIPISTNCYTHILAADTLPLLWFEHVPILHLHVLSTRSRLNSVFDSVLPLTASPRLGVFPIISTNEQFTGYKGITIYIADKELTRRWSRCIYTSVCVGRSVLFTGLHMNMPRDFSLVLHNDNLTCTCVFRFTPVATNCHFCPNK